MTRVIAGAAGGRRLVVPRGGTRPTSDRVREALFSRVEHGRDLDGARVLDLCAGSGALGLEAASRGAGAVVLVDAAPAAAAACRANAAALGLPAAVVVRAAGVAAVLAAGPAAVGGAVDLVLLDPPYDLPEAELGRWLAALGDPGGAGRPTGGGWLAPGADVVVERSSRSPEPSWGPHLGATGSRRYGETVLWWAALSS